jgi:hypothetical protein
MPSDLGRLAARVASDPTFLANQLLHFQVRHDLTDAALAALLGCPVELLTRVRLCGCVRADHFADDCRAVACKFGLRLEALEDVCRPWWSGPPTTRAEDRSPARSRSRGVYFPTRGAERLADRLTTSPGSSPGQGKCPTRAVSATRTCRFGVPGVQCQPRVPEHTKLESPPSSPLNSGASCPRARKNLRGVRS